MTPSTRPSSRSSAHPGQRGGVAFNSSAGNYPRSGVYPECGVLSQNPPRTRADSVPTPHHHVRGAFLPLLLRECSFDLTGVIRVTAPPARYGGMAFTGPLHFRFTFLRASREALRPGDGIRRLP